MTVWAGVDIGNATTEVVLCRVTGELEVVASTRVPTRAEKDLCAPSTLPPNWFAR